MLSGLERVRVCFCLREVLIDLHICVPGIITVSAMRSGTLLLSSKLSNSSIRQKIKTLESKDTGTSDSSKMTWCRLASMETLH